MAEVLQTAMEGLIGARKRISTRVNSLSTYRTSVMNLEAGIASASKLPELQMCICMAARGINVDIESFEGYKRFIFKGLINCTSFARSMFELMPDDLELDLPMASCEFLLGTDDRLPVLTDLARRGIEEMTKLEAEEAEAEPEDRLVKDTASLITHLKNMNSILMSIKENAAAGGETSSQKGLEESYKGELFAFEAGKVRIVQTMLKLSDALIKEIEPQRELSQAERSMSVAEYMEPLKEMLDLPSKEIPLDLLF
ncbi:unnamed protein product [Linum tenue]|uniref:Uncharacterized protein n=1 Tax=Linum tenue TaxID=586396 RepID=A0AAV0IIR9_9ROSI|nr:unnamed protein product [Linum tenue]